jgi:hypothetical protein
LPLANWPLAEALINAVARLSFTSPERRTYFAAMVDPNELVARVISLPHRTDRRTHFALQAMAQGIAHRFVDGLKMDTPAAGINEAHRACVAAAKANGEPFALVMEDDAWFPARDGYAHFMRQMPQEFDLYLGGVYGRPEDADGVCTWFNGLHCYVVAARFYDTYLAIDPSTHIDHALRGLGRYVVCRPYACMQLSDHSDNVGVVTDYAEWSKERVYRG